MSILWSCVCSICSGYPPASGGIVQPSALKRGVVPVVPRDAAQQPNLLRWMRHDRTEEHHGTMPIAGTKLTISFWWHTCVWKNHCIESRVPYKMTPPSSKTLFGPSFPGLQSKKPKEDWTRWPNSKGNTFGLTTRGAESLTKYLNMHGRFFDYAIIAGVWPKKKMLLQWRTSR